MGKERFKNNLTRTLKDYYMDLSELAETRLQRAVTRLLRSRWSRLRIAQTIVDNVIPDHEEARTRMEQRVLETVNKLPDHENWIAMSGDTVSTTEQPSIEESLVVSEAPGKESVEEASEDDDIDEAYKEGSALPNIAEAELFFFGNAFNRLSANLARFLVPASLAWVTRTIMSVPTENIWFSPEDDLSISNGLKGLIEDTAEERWEWWPLQPRMRSLQSDQVRLHWKCVSSLCLKSILSGIDHLSRIVGRISGWSCRPHRLRAINFSCRGGKSCLGMSTYVLPKSTGSNIPIRSARFPTRVNGMARPVPRLQIHPKISARFVVTEIAALPATVRILELQPQWRPVNRARTQLSPFLNPDACSSFSA